MSHTRGGLKMIVFLLFLILITLICPWIFRFIAVLVGLAIWVMIFAIAAHASPVSHTAIFQSTHCVAQWVDLPGQRVWFTGFIKHETIQDPKNPKDSGAEGPMFKVGNRSTWWGDASWPLAAAALNQLQKTCPEVEVAG